MKTVALPVTIARLWPSSRGQFSVTVISDTPGIGNKAPPAPRKSVSEDVIDFLAPSVFMGRESVQWSMGLNVRGSTPAEATVPVMNGDLRSIDSGTSIGTSPWLVN